MRVFSFIFVVYMLVLLAQPCQEFVASASGDSAACPTTAVVRGDTPESGSKTDGCSPFCICSCCSINSMGAHTVSVAIESPATVNAIPREIAAYSSQHTSNYLASIWQPPKA
ncbi:MAG TPA: hypothetical protein PLR83_04085 [Pyrinomonadaceae bacterium]|nr:hypothetical protein [Pyrinomonadaceae bacterium]